MYTCHSSSCGPGDDFSVGAEVALVVSESELEVVELVVDEDDVFRTFGSLLRINFVKEFSKVFARAFISVVRITGSSLGLTLFCFSTHSFNHTSWSLSAASSESISSTVHFEGMSFACSAVRLARASVMNIRDIQLTRWELLRAEGKASISL